LRKFHGFSGQSAKFARLFNPNLGPLGAKLFRYKKISATLLAKVTDIPHFTPQSRRHILA